MSGLWLSRIRLRQGAAVSALARLLVPDAADARVAAGHHLIWAAFADGPERRRDFLWREEAPGRFLALSARPPVEETGLFAIDSRPFAPELAEGDRLRFLLRANATVSRKGAPGLRGKRHDVVMDALKSVPPKVPPEDDERAVSRRAEKRPGLIAAAGRDWLMRQGERHGFEVADGLAVDGYERHVVERPGARAMVLGALEFEGVLKVTDPARFLPALAGGFGKARAFGFGLMLIRRA